MRRSRTQDPLRAATRYLAFQPTRLSPASVRKSSSASTNPLANDSASSVAPPANLWTPRLLTARLDEYAVGQSAAKRTLAVAVHTHYIKVRHALAVRDRRRKAEQEAAMERLHEMMVQEEAAFKDADKPSAVPARKKKAVQVPVEKVVEEEEDELEYSKSNCLIIGPTGTGKTLLARTLAKELDVPLAIADATSLTQAGYVGDDVEMVIQRLYTASGQDAEATGYGIVVIDEIDKLARREPSATKDVSGEGVQQALLRLLEGCTVTLTVKPATNEAAGSPDIIAPSGDRKGRRAVRRGLDTGPMGGPGMTEKAKSETVMIDTTNILFIVSGAFVGLDKIILARTNKKTIGFGASPPSSSSSSAIRKMDASPSFPGLATTPAAPASSSPSLSSDTTPTPLLPLPPSPPTPKFPSRKAPPTTLDLLEPEDLIAYGFIPEMIGRLPVIARLRELDQADLLRILTEPKNSLVKQFTQIFKDSGANLHITTSALRAIADIAVKSKTGARGLRRTLEKILEEPLYDTPGSSIVHVLITRAVVQGKAEAFYYSRGEGTMCEAEAARDERGESGGASHGVGGDGSHRGGGIP